MNHNGIESKNTILTCRFVEKYNELKQEGKIEEEKLFEETGKALLASGILLQRRGTEKVSLKYSLYLSLFIIYLASGSENFISRPLMLSLV